MRRQHVAQIEGGILGTGSTGPPRGRRGSPRGQASSHQQNKQAGPFEEHAKVKADTAPVDQEAQHDSGGQTQQRPQRRPDTDILLECRQQKEDRLQPLTGDREKTIITSAQPW